MCGSLSAAIERASRRKRSTNDRVVRHRGGQHLDRDVAAERRLVALVDHAHAAAAEFLDDVVVAQTLRHASFPLPDAAMLAPMPVTGNGAWPPLGAPARYEPERPRELQGVRSCASSSRCSPAWSACWCWRRSALYAVAWFRCRAGDGADLHGRRSAADGRSATRKRSRAARTCSPPAAAPTATAPPARASCCSTPARWRRSCRPTSPRGGRLKDLSADQVAAAIRHGVRPDGRPLVFMPSEDFHEMSDADVAALVAYLQSLPPSANVPAPVEVRPLARVLWLFGKFPLLPAEAMDHSPRARAAPAVAATAEYGKYLAQGCTGCHGRELRRPARARHAARHSRIRRTSRRRRSAAGRRRTSSARSARASGRTAAPSTPSCPGRPSRR